MFLARRTPARPYSTISRHGGAQRTTIALAQRVQFSLLAATKHANPNSRPRPHYSSFKDVRSLVCDQCWSNVFDTLDWQRVCNGERDESDNAIALTTETTLPYVKESSHSCSWCGLLWSFLGNIGETDPKFHIPWSARLLFIRQDDNPTSTPAGIPPLNSNLLYLNIDDGTNSRSHPLGWSTQLSVYTLPSDPAARYITARPLQTDVSPHVTQTQVESWLRECEGHECCSPQDNVALPPRVIDVSPPDDPTHPRVVFSDGRRDKYAALVYSQGCGPISRQFVYQSKLSTSADERRYEEEDLDLDALPKTFQDAIEVARTLPVEWLWIDSLCKDQDSELDVAAELAQIENIYRNSLVTIVATSAKDVHAGFLETKPGLQTLDDISCNVWDGRKSPNGSFRRPWTIPFKIADGKFGTISLNCLRCEIEYEEGEEPMNRDAWTLHPQLVAPRVLSYASHTLQWRCKAGTRNLGDALHQARYPSNTISALSKPKKSPRDELLRWLQMVDVYSGREVAVPNDKLSALAGIADQFSSSLGTYHAGIWDGSHVVLQLAWSRSTARKPNTPKYNRAPSWSWASVDSGVWTKSWDEDDQDPDIDEYFKPLCEVLSISATPRTSTMPFGEVTAGYLTLRGQTRNGWLIQSKEQDAEVNVTKTIVWHSDSIVTGAAAEVFHLDWVNKDQELDDLDPNGSSRRTDLNPWVNAKFDALEDSPPVFVTCMPLFRGFGIILKREEGGGSYMRIGSFENYLTSDSDFEGSPTEEITIT